MPCYHPLKGWRSRKTNDATGKRSIVFDIKLGFEDMPVEVPCGRCIGCKLEHSRQWAMRILHEASLHQQNCFITLTYDNHHLPPDGSLQLDHFQKFFKRLRKKYGEQIKYYHCGEYGEKFQRPHYHAIIFNFDFPDKQLYRVTPGGSKLFTSQSLNALWPFGFTLIGSVSFESAAYVARYVTKKLTGNRPFKHVTYNSDGSITTENLENSDEHYQVINYDTGEITYRIREYATMSRNPGIGKNWIEKYKSDVYPADHVIINSKPVKPPKYYDRYLEKEHLEEYEKIKIRRAKERKIIPAVRLEVMEKVKIAKTKILRRNYETGNL